jgi:RNA polymerase sigma factor (sigma-70 family)
MAATKSSDPKWPAQFKELCGELRQPRDSQSRDDARSRIWLLLNSLLSQYLRFHSSRLGRVAQEDLEDIASGKSLEIMRQIELGMWEVTSGTAPQITGYLSRVAKNGLVDRLREIGRRVAPTSEDQPEWDVDAGGQGKATAMMSNPDPPDRQVERREFVEALRECVSKMESRSRLVWFFRVLCGMSSKEIAAHPSLSLKPGHVDVILQRSREMMKSCMHQKGHEPRDMPVGTFVELWKVCQLDAVIE